jgi:PPM family protein phosphatase
MWRERSKLTKLVTLGPAGSAILSWLSDTWQPNGGQVVEEIGAVVATSKGLVRSENQDRCLIVRSRVQGLVCFVVCDGIGGMANGGHAAEIAVSRFVESLVDDTTADLKARLVRAAEAANAEVHARYSEKGGTTLAAVVLDLNNRFYGVTAGDTRIYALKGRTRVEQISSDDTIAGELQRIKGVNVPQEDVDPSARQLAQYIGMGPGIQPRIYDSISADQAGWIMITTDGVHSMPAKTLEQFAVHAPTPYKLGTRLIQTSEWLGGFDNASLIIIPSVPKTTIRQAETNLCDSLELWSPFSKMQVLNWRKAPVASVAETAARPPYAAPPAHVEPKSQTRKQTSADQTRRKPDRKRPAAKHPDRKQPPQLGIELIDNPPLQAVPSDQRREPPAPNAPERDHKSSIKDPEYSPADSAAGVADSQPETPAIHDKAGEK